MCLQEIRHIFIKEALSDNAGWYCSKSTPSKTDATSSLGTPEATRHGDPWVAERTQACCIQNRCIAFTPKLAALTSSSAIGALLFSEPTPRVYGFVDRDSPPVEHSD